MAEVVPSPMKSTAIGLGSAFGAIGGSFAPYLMQLQFISWWLPLAVSIVLAIFTSLAIYRVLPETKSAPTFRSLEDALVFYVKTRSVVDVVSENLDKNVEIVLDCLEESS